MTPLCTISANIIQYEVLAHVCAVVPAFTSEVVALGLERLVHVSSEIIDTGLLFFFLCESLSGS